MVLSIFSRSNSTRTSPFLTGEPSSMARSTTRGMVQLFGRIETSAVRFASKTPLNVTSTLNGPFSTLAVAGLWPPEADGAGAAPEDCARAAVVGVIAGIDHDQTRARPGTSTQQSGDPNALRMIFMGWPSVRERWERTWSRDDSPGDDPKPGRNASVQVTTGMAGSEAKSDKSQTTLSRRSSMALRAAGDAGCRTNVPFARAIDMTRAVPRSPGLLPKTRPCDTLFGFKTS